MLLASRAPEHHRDVELSDLLAAVRRSWSARTSVDGSAWTPLNPARGQCAVTALVIQDHLGGGLRRCASPTGSHYYNLLDDGTVLDATAGQFGPGFEHDDVRERSRDYVLSFPDTRQRYGWLRHAVDEVLVRAR